MNPYPDDVLAELAQSLVTRFAEAAQPAYSAALIAYTGLVLSAAAEEWDQAAWRLREDNRAIRALFTLITPLFADQSIGKEIARHIASDDEDIHVRALRVTNEAMRECMTLVHALVEEMESDAARDAEDAIWAELSADTHRRKAAWHIF